MKNKIMQLTKKLQVSSGGHILYFYDEVSNYINNALAYVVTGIEQKHHLLIIENRQRYQLLHDKLQAVLSQEQLTKVHFVDNYEFYRMYGDFHCQSIINHFMEILEPFIENQISIRTWAHVEWKEQDDILHKLEEFENAADSSVNAMGLISVCAYNANTAPASLQTIMMRNHEYFMTDKELVRSSLYTNSNKTVIFPSLSVQSEMQSEMDLYKQKLDFIHVVSHEVRNPLTVIKAYASMILGLESDLSGESVDKLTSIVDYVDVIDNEITHIIHTEQMLTNDLLWNKEIIEPLPIIQEVIDFMCIKARTQDIQLMAAMSLDGSERLLNNKIGLRLILSNVLSNSIKYSAEQTKVAFFASVEDSKLLIRVKDQGIGMNQEQIKKLFQKYGKMNQEKSGQGIGLYTVKMLLDHYHGSIRVESEVNEGTEVHVEFPLVDMETNH